MLPLMAVTDTKDKLPLPSVLMTWLFKPSDVGNSNPAAVNLSNFAESADISPVTLTPESVVSNFFELS